MASINNHGRPGKQCRWQLIWLWIFLLANYLMDWLSEWVCK